MTEIALVGRAQLGDKLAMEELLKSVEQQLFRHIVTITGDADIASDVLQETLITIYRKLKSLREPRWFKAWAYRIATRHATRRAKASGRWESLDDSEDSVTMVEAEVPDYRIEILEEAMTRLSPASQVVIRMHYSDDLTIAEIAEALEIPPGTVKSRLSYGISRLRATTESGHPPARAR